MTATRAPATARRPRAGRAGRTPGPGARRRIPFARALGPLLLLALWQLCSATGLLDPQTLAPPGAVGQQGWELLSSGQLGHHLWVSLQRAALGLAFGTTAGVLLALAAGLSRLGEALIDGTAQLFRALPILALVPLAILWFGIGEEVKIILVALGTFFPVYVNTHAALTGLDLRWAELARTVGLGRLGFLRRIALPGAAPGFFTGLRLAVTVSWLVLVVSEQINADSGIGYLMEQARTFGQTDVIVVGLVVYGLLGLASDTLVRLLERRVLRWRTTLG
ncbi:MULTISPECIES: ABC transporter permease [Kitasatospora]|uniref:Putative aliphatic sulfonate ABC transporter permease protein n=1 Tax=Kitasatospora setae (strain ATCC 33774 / DSM 43861 / JCM 3304 / KCC A-0304 / NBRC 14216 / KM-6054) TaxID=452652 RepID=E4NFL0_KITSK|nr:MULTISPECIES: ABC transporter permease [Kitasatospora]BAJ30290.1 putative aliphatic sulfonate ABC transporter permease protein [Kitasatospora setae KM-6054]